MFFSKLKKKQNKIDIKIHVEPFKVYFFRSCSLNKEKKKLQILIFFLSKTKYKLKKSKIKTIKTNGNILLKCLFSIKYTKKHIGKSAKK